MNIEKEIKALEERHSKEIAELKAKLLTPQFEKGKWYRDNDGRLIFAKRFDEKHIVGFGFTLTGIWDGNESYWLYDYAGNILKWGIRPATESEIKEALVKEAEKRGFKEDCRFYQPWNKNTKTATSYNYEFAYKNGDCLYFRGDVIYQNGKWAEIIQDEAIKIGGETVIIAENKLSVTIGKEIYSHAELASLASFLYQHSDQVKHLAVGCFGQYSVTYKEVKSILERLK